MFHLSNDERVFLKRVVGRFLKDCRGTPVQRTRVEFGSNRQLLDKLVAEELLKTNGDFYLPTIYSLEFVERDLRDFAFKRIELCLRSLRSLYVKEARDSFSLEELLEEVKRTDPGFDENDVLPALLLSTDLGFYSGYGYRSEQDGILRFNIVTLMERIMDFRSAEETAGRLLEKKREDWQKSLLGAFGSSLVLEDPEIKALLLELAGQYVSSGKAISSHNLKVRLAGKSSRLEDFEKAGLVRTIGDKVYPALNLFENSEESLRNHARCCAHFVLEALRRHYAARGYRKFGFGEVLHAVKSLDSDFTPQMVNLGMLLSLDFKHLLGGCSISSLSEMPGSDAIASVTVKEGILEFKSFEDSWVAEFTRRAEDFKRLGQIGESHGGGAAKQHKLSPSVDFAFVSDTKIRMIVERDYGELQKAKSAEMTKTRLVLSGCLLEALLLDSLKRDEKRARGSSKAPKEPLEEWDLSNLLLVAIEIGTINPGAEKLGHVVREFRNLIHPGLEIRSNQTVGVEEANIVEEVLNLVIRDLQKATKKP